MKILALAVTMLALALARPVMAAPLDLSPFLGDPELSQVQVSPSGRYLTYVKSDGKTDRIFVQEIATGQAKLLLSTKAATAKVAAQEWRQRVAYLHWKTEDYLLVSIGIPEVNGIEEEVVGENLAHLLLPREGGKAIGFNVAGAGGNQRIAHSTIVDLEKDPDHVLIQMNGDLYKYGIKDKTKVLIESGGPLITSFGLNRDGQVVYRTRRSGSSIAPYAALDVRAPGTQEWTKVWEVHRKDFLAMDDIEMLEATPDPAVMYVLYTPHDSDKTDTQSIRLFDLRTKTLGDVVWSNPKYDVSFMVTSEQSGAVMGACYWTDVLNCEFKDPVLNAEYKGLQRYFDNRGSIGVVSMSDDAKTWAVSVVQPDEPTSYYIYDRTAHHLSPLGAAWPKRAAAVAAHRRRFDYKAHDGTALTAYVTTPNAPGPHPLVVMPHGGPQARDDLSFDLWAEILASRGYEVIQPNFRGSTGYGRAFKEAGFRQWGGLMQDDVTDAVKAIEATNEVDPKKVCIVGASYGGYAALYGVASDPTLYQCAVSIEGVTDLAETVRDDRDWYGDDSYTYRYELKEIGDPSKEGEHMRLKSPAQIANLIQVPVLLIHGTEDGVVDIQQSRRMKRALDHAGKKVQYIEIKKMGHRDWLDQHTTTVFKAVDEFLRANLHPDEAVAPSVGAKVGG